MADEAGGKYRAQVIERAVNLEWLMSALISQHYMKRMQPTSCVGYCMEYRGQRARLTR